MIKFWEEDFKYIKRSQYTHFFLEGFGYRYTFSVRGESANYLINKYNLRYPNVKVCMNYGHNAVTIDVISETGDSSMYDVYNAVGEDLIQLGYLLQETIKIDLRNYEEYKCDDWYKKDGRWE